MVVCHFETKVKSLKLSGIKRLTSASNSSWKIPPKRYYNCNNLMTYFNTNHKLLTNKKIPTFYTHIYHLYMKFFKTEHEHMNEILNQSSWLNSSNHC